MKKNITPALCIVVAIIISACTISTPIPVLTEIPLPTETSVSVPTYTPIPTLTPTPEVPIGFQAGGRPFRFLGAFVAGWYWGMWSEENDIALITEAKQAGITVLHVMPPNYHTPLGSFHEEELVKLDHFMDVAYQNNMYVTISFVHGLSMTSWTGSPFYDPGGVEALIHRPEFRTGFKTHMERLVTRVNTVSGRNYTDDPAVMAWIVIEEIVSAPWNYSEGFPEITVAELAEWLEENAAYLKSIDPNHLVTINTTAALSTFSDNLEQRWEPIIEAPSLDFVEAEDAEARILLHSEWMYTIDELYAVGKPMVMMLSYTGGDVDKAKYCNDYQWQSETMKQVADLYLDKGAAGFTVFSWQASTVTTPDYDSCYSYHIGNNAMVQTLQTIAGKLGEQNIPPSPLKFVTLAE